jgi:hypothetical protein
MDGWLVGYGWQAKFSLVPSSGLTIPILGSVHDMMPLISLRLGVERVDGAKAEILGTSAVWRGADACCSCRRLFAKLVLFTKN